MFKLQLVVTPSLDLRGFNGLFTQSEINHADATLPGPVEKFSYLADQLLFVGTAQRHLFYGFYFELPIVLLCEIESFQFANMLRMTTYHEGLLVKGLVTAPLDLWKEFIKFGVKADASEVMQKFSRAVLKLLPLKAEPELRMLQ